MNVPQTERDDSWFQELIKPLRARLNQVHPSRAILRAYLQGRLPDTTLTEVSQHALTCPECAQQLALMRQRKLEQGAIWREIWDQLPRSIRAHFTVYIFALLALFTLNALLVTMLPAPMASRTCAPPVDITGSQQDPQASDGNLKFEGLNRPVKLPNSLSGVCLPAPASRPLWQTWWINWVFLLWTMLLGLHILWDWLVISSTPQRPAPASATIRSVGFVSVFV